MLCNIETWRNVKLILLHASYVKQKFLKFSSFNSFIKCKLKTGKDNFFVLFHTDLIEVDEDNNSSSFSLVHTDEIQSNNNEERSFTNER